MQYPLCRHIRTNGSQCKSPSLTEKDWCYYHDRLHQRHSGYRYTKATQGYLLPGQHIQLSPLEDRDSVQVALSQVINALATGRLETKRAMALLYGLQLASTNAARPRAQLASHEIVRSAEPTPEGLDLAEPGHTINVIDSYKYTEIIETYDCDCEQDPCICEDPDPEDE